MLLPSDSNIALRISLRALLTLLSSSLPLASKAFEDSLWKAVSRSSTALRYFRAAKS
jgi:hypothetical protein